jgi:TolA-binding protein
MTCRQSWKVEAVRDGQLAAPDSQVIASHLQVCMHCTAEGERLTRIGDAVRAIPVREPSALVVRIQRRKLLEEATAQVSPAAVRSPSVRRLGAPPLRYALAAAAVFALVFAGLRFRSKSSPGPLATSAPTGDVTMVSSDVEVRATPESRWSQTSEPAQQLIALEQGVLWTKITHKRPHPPVVFRVPDGQIEDVGTTFTVTVRDGQTQRVAVDEGTVVLHGFANQRMSAGEVWERKAAAGTANTPNTAPAPAAPTTAAEPAPGAQAEAPSAPAPAATPDDVAASKPRARATSKPKGRNATEESRLLKKGTAALHAGRYSEAAHLFERFAADYPQSGRAEDVAYLHALSLGRAGRSDEAYAAAKDYLARFPQGFRRTEMEKYVSEVEHAKH